jgi:filamentous hemagglutinin
MTYRARQQALMNEGRFVEAIQMDINDARVLFGDRYATAIEEMLRYTSTVDPATYTPGGRVAVRK